MAGSRMPTFLSAHGYEPAVLGWRDCWRARDGSRDGGLFLFGALVHCSQPRSTRHRAFMFKNRTASGKPQAEHELTSCTDSPQSVIAYERKLPCRPLLRN